MFRRFLILIAMIAVAITCSPDRAFAQTSPDFSCASQEYSGYYTNSDYQGQVFWACDFKARTQTTYICPNMTLFSQYYYTCMWAPAVDVGLSSEYYYLAREQGLAPDVVQGITPSSVERF